MSMKHFVLLAGFLAALTFQAGAEEYYILNQTNAILYVAEAAALDGESLATVEFDPDAAYRQVPPGGVLPCDPERAIAGFAFSRGSFQLPTFFLPAPGESDSERAAGADRRYIPVRSDMLTNARLVSSSAMTTLLSLPRLDHQYLEWVGREARVARGKSRAPLGVFADFGDGREPIDLDDSLLWQRGGTDLQWLKSETTGSDFFLSASVYTAFAPGTALFVYLYEDSGSVPVATMEFPTAANGLSEVSQGEMGRSGFVLLWLPGQPEPRVVGNIVATDFFLEAQIWRASFEGALQSDPGSLSVEVSTASSAAGIWEEFVLVRDTFAVLFGE